MVVSALVAVLAACTAGAEPSPPVSAPVATPSADGASTPATSPSPEPTEDEPTAPEMAEFDAAAAMRLVREIAAIGPREATSGAFTRATRLVADRFAAMGYQVTFQDFRVPAGESWGVPVDAGSTRNLVARLPGPPDDGPPVVVGAHLDTVPQAPGAEDNASGVAVLLQIADLARQAGTRRPVTFVAFGAEEPRGPADDEHHFGSQVYVRRVVEGAATPLAAMVSLDRVGTRGPVPVCTGGLSPLRVRDQLLAAADRLGVPARPCDNRTSDHWPFEKAGETVARVGGLDYAAYHSADDVPAVVSERQLDRVGRTVWEWLRAG
jgi:hypothetical protein